MTDRTPTPTLRRMPRQAVVMLVVVGIALLAVYLPSLVRLVGTWIHNEEYNHGLLIPLLTAYFIWDRWDHLREVPIEHPAWSTLAGWVLLVVSMFVNLAGAVGAMPSLSHMSLIGTLAALVLLLLGGRLFVQLLFPLVFLSLMIPPPSQVHQAVTVPLQQLTSTLSARILNVLHLYVYQQGNVLHFGKGMQLTVAEACSGMRSLTGLVAIGMCLARLVLHRLGPRVTLVVLSVPVAIACNVLRVVVTGILFKRVSPEAARGFMHFFTGWIIFLVALAIMSVLARVLAIVFEHTPNDTQPDRAN